MDPVRASLPRRSRANHHRIPKLKGNKTLDDEKWRCGSQVTTGARHLYRTSLLVCLGNSGAAEGHQQPCEQNFFPPCGQNTAEQKSTRPACAVTRHAGGQHPLQGRGMRVATTHRGARCTRHCQRSRCSLHHAATPPPPESCEIRNNSESTQESRLLWTCVDRLPRTHKGPEAVTHHAALQILAVMGLSKDVLSHRRHR